MKKNARRRVSDREYDAIAEQLLNEFANDYPEDLEIVISWLREAASNPDALQTLIRYKHQPVSVREFVESPSFMNKPGVLWPLVMEALIDINDGTHTECVLTGGIGVAKALDLDTPIPTPSGWKRNGDLQDGDEVFDEQGSVCRVVKAHPTRYDRPCYEVRFDDGSVIVADAEHLWRVWSISQRSNRTRPEVLTTAQIVETASKGYAIEVAGALELPDVAGLGIDPYVLGVWLGDGSSDGNRVWSVDDEVVTELRRHYWITEQPRPNAVPARTIHGINPVLRHYGLLKNKHVPDVFKRASTAQRLALVQGLMDSDGTIDKRTGRCAFTQKNKRLANDMFELLVSVGLKPFMRCEKAILRGKDCGPVYRIGFTPREQVVFRLPRKAKWLKPCQTKTSTAGWRYIKGVVPVASRPVRCITVDSVSSLYLAGPTMVPTHNTTIALYSQAYQLYLLSCMRNPHEEFDLDPSSEIVIIFQSLNKELATGIDYARFRDMIDKAPYFSRNFAFRKDLESEMRFPNNIIVKPISGQDTGAIGANVIGGLIDEINFMAVIEKSKLSRDGEVYDQAIKNYNSIARRRESRFMQKGSLPGMLCLVSSRNYPGQFTDRKEEEARTNPLIYVYDKRLWDIRPERFGGDWFHVFIGDETRRPFILSEDATVALDDEPLVVAVPEEYRKTFQNDLLTALREVAGVSTQALHPFMLNIEAVASCFGTVPSIASREDCDFDKTKILLYPKRVVSPKEFRLAHVDLAYSKDSAGISVGFVPEFRRMNRGEYVEILPIVQFDMILEVKPPHGGEIEFENIRRLLYTLRDKLGIPIKWVSFDGFQSRDSMQILHQKGFIVGYQSMDVDTRAFDTTKQAFSDRRVIAPHHSKAQREMTTLEIDTKKRKIDHPPRGSKDVADSMAGVIHGLSIRREIWVRHQVPMHLVPRSIAEVKTPESATKVNRRGEIDREEIRIA